MITKELRKIYSAINQVEVKGETNIACMFVALSNLTKLIEELEASQEGEEKQE